MKVALFREKDVPQIYLQLTNSEASRLIKFLKEQLCESGQPASYAERSSFEDFRSNTARPETSRGLITFAIVEA